MREKPEDGRTEPQSRGHRLSKTARKYAAKAKRMGIDNPEDLMDFEAAQRRPLTEHLQRSRIKTYKPVLGRPALAGLQDDRGVPAVVQR